VEKQEVLYISLCLRARVHVGVVEMEHTCAWAHVALLIQHATRRHTVTSVPSCAIKFFNIISSTAWFSEKKLMDIKSVF
jgi:hypothetical protein